jgi:hypothetical protein
LYKSNVVTGGPKTEIPSTDFLLRATYNLQTGSCCTNLPSDSFFVGCTNSPNLYYKFKAYWRPNATVPNPTIYKIYLEGGWQQ